MLDDGNTVDFREAHQSSLRINQQTQGLNNLTKPVLGIVLAVHPADSLANRYVAHTSDRHTFTAVCDVLVTNDGKTSAFWKLSNVIIPTAHPTGLDNFEECLPRGSSKYITGSVFDVTTQEADINDLDGDWVVISFIGGNVNLPYISNFWPNPRNKYDTQTLGQGHPNSSGRGQALSQFTGRGRYFRRINGVEHVVNEQGDIFISTHYSGGQIVTNSEVGTERGRFTREVQPGPGGGIRINVKTSQPLELNWNEQEDGIGLNSTHDPQLPQTNPQQTTPYSLGSRTATFIRIQNQAVTFQTPGLFSVESQKHFKLESGEDSDIIVGTRLGTQVGNTMDTTVGVTYNLKTLTGDINISADAANIVQSADQDINLITNVGDIDLLSGNAVSVTAASSLTLNAATNVDISATTGFINVSTPTGPLTLTGNTIALVASQMSFATSGGVSPVVSFAPVGGQPPILGTAFNTEFQLLATAWQTFLTAVAADPALTASTTTSAGALNTAIGAFLASLPSTFASNVSMD